MKISDRIVEKLLELGCIEAADNKSKKYRKFYMPANIESIQGQCYWVGKSGSLRKGKGVSDSISITDYFRKKHGI